MASDKRRSSAAYLSAALKIRCKSARLLLHKLRSATGQRDARYLMEGIVEFDDTCFGGPGSEKRQGKLPKAAAALSKDKDGRPKHLKMRADADLKGKTTGSIAKRAIVQSSVVETDALASCRRPLREKFSHRRRVHDAGSQMLVRLHAIISNAKAFVQGAFHGLDGLHLQRCLDEFCRLFNRRRRARTGYSSIC